MGSYLPNPAKPKRPFPAGACDTHFHVFGPFDRFPVAADATYQPAGDAPKDALFRLHAHLGVQRGVVVQSAIHRFDNSAAADLIATRPKDYKGVALVPTDIPDDELKALTRKGFLGARFHYMKLAHIGAHTPIEDVLALAKRLAPLGWHLQIHLDATLLGDLAPALNRSPVPVVIDHMGRIDASKGIDDPAFKALLKFMDKSTHWVKVSGSERASRQGAPWRDAVPFGKKLVAEFGDRAVWGTDWPHPNLKEIPDDGMLADLVEEMAPSAAARQKLLVDNPARLYRFT